MKKFKLFSTILGAVFLAFLIIIKLAEKPEDILQKHLKKRYNKEFVIYYSGNRNDGRNSWFEAEIYPKELAGTSKEYDTYYWAKGFVENGKGGDTYGGVLLNESANEFYLPKLKELFGENVLPILNVEGYYEKTDFQEEMARRREFYKEDPDGKFFPISGGIYIFGRVENDEDREKYREQIYKFVQFMKETGTFEYVSLGVEIIDERSLTNYFDNNRNNLFKAKQKYKTADEFIKYREKIFKEAEKEFNQMIEEDKKIKINSYLKSDFMRENFINNGDNAYSVLYHVGIISPKYQSTQPQKEGKINEYNSLNDIKLLNRMKLIYKEYFINKDGEVILTN